MTLTPPPQRCLGMICFALLQLSPTVAVLAGRRTGRAGARQPPGPREGSGCCQRHAGAQDAEDCVLPTGLCLVSFPVQVPQQLLGSLGCNLVARLRSALRPLTCGSPSQAQRTMADSKWHGESSRMVPGPWPGCEPTPALPSCPPPCGVQRFFWALTRWGSPSEECCCGCVSRTKASPCSPSCSAHVCSQNPYSCTTATPGPALLLPSQALQPLRTPTHPTSTDPHFPTANQPVLQGRLPW